jgi:hypothetical protein
MTVKLNRAGRCGYVLLAALWLSVALEAQKPNIATAAKPISPVTLAGTWSFALDPQDKGHAEKWWRKKLGPDDIYLPGTTDQGGYGTRTHGPEAGWLSRPFTYQGAAWYQQDVTIPESWRGQHIELFLERAHWQTEVWVDDASYGSRNSLSTPHVYDLTKALAPGRHRITLCVDNSLIVDVGVRASSVTDYTQTNWNGVVGRIELEARPPVWIESAQVYPDGTTYGLRVEAVIRNATGGPVEGELFADGPTRFSFSGSEQTITGRTRRTPWLEGGAPQETELRLTARAGGTTYWDQLPVTTKSREFTAGGTQFLLNGRAIFLRGTLECANFPLTGHPPMDLDSWNRLFRVAHEYGLNHIRFHSWCPPEAAFEAADSARFLLQIELPVWSHQVGKDPALNEFMRAEGHRILRAYGNHPSFAMLTLGNELTGDFGFMDQLVAEFKKADPRHLYTFTDDIARRAPGPTSDYHVTNATKAGRLRIWGSRFGKETSGTDVDFSSSVAAMPVPLIAHELGQWAVYPSYEELSRYTGLLKPRNLEAFRDQLAARGMLDQARAFQEASGRFAWTIYKEDIETALRTPNFGGFQLLQLQDFSGQGEALVGLLGAFWESKGILTPEEFRRFVSDTVPLIRFPKHVWTNDETFTGRTDLSDFNVEPPLPGGVWIAADDTGAELAHGALGQIKMPLAKVTRARHLKLSMQVSTGYNTWDIWVYPKKLEIKEAPDVLVTTSFDEAARRKLAAGGKVVLLWPADQPNAHMQPVSFLPVFWSLSWFPKQPGTMGILCDPKHPALAEFPTENHSNWQWWELTEGGRAFILDDLPLAYRPLVQVIDDYHRNHKLGAVFEAKVGEGKLLVSSLDLATRLDERVVARQLRYSLLAYADGPNFQPSAELPMDKVTALLRVEAARPTEFEGSQHKEAAPWPKK